LLNKKVINNICIQPAAGELGTASSSWYLHNYKESNVYKELDIVCGSYLGLDFTSSEIEAELTACVTNFHKLDEDPLIESVATVLADKKTF
jgi:carbamoyltransferase